jgi:transposase
VRAALYTFLGADFSQIHGFGPYTVLRLVAECGDDMTKWPSVKHFTSWLCLAPGNKISGGRVLRSKTRRSSSRAAALLRIAAVNIGKTHTALGAFYCRLAARAGKAKAVTATARKLAVLFYNAVRFGMAYADPGADHYEQTYRRRVVHQLDRRARQMGFTLVPNAAESTTVGVS